MFQPFILVQLKRQLPDFVRLSLSQAAHLNICEVFFKLY